MKLRLMTYMWRLQQSQLIISMIMWAALLTLTSYQYVGGSIGEFFGSVYLGLLFLFLIIFAFIILIGFAFDRILKLWKEQNIVIAHRNPYLRERMYAKEVLMWSHLLIPVLKKYEDKDQAVKKQVEFMEKWISKNMQIDSELYKEVKDAEAWVLAGQG
jgi:hypothetical protein